MSSEFNPYDVLGIPKDATEEEIKAAFRMKSKLFHPDSPESRKAFGEEECKKKQIEINEAYSILSNPDLRDQFDRDGKIAKELPDKIVKREIFAAIVTEIFRNQPVTPHMLNTILPRRITEIIHDIESRQEKESEKLRGLEKVKTAYQGKDGEAIEVLLASLDGVIEEQTNKVKHIEDHLRRHKLVYDMINKEFKEPEDFRPDFFKEKSRIQAFGPVFREGEFRIFKDSV